MPYRLIVMSHYLINVQCASLLNKDLVLIPSLSHQSFGRKLQRIYKFIILGIRRVQELLSCQAQWSDPDPPAQRRHSRPQRTLLRSKEGQQ